MFWAERPDEEVDVNELSPDVTTFFNDYVFGHRYPQLVVLMLGEAALEHRIRNGRNKGELTDGWTRLLHTAGIQTTARSRAIPIPSTQSGALPTLRSNQQAQGCVCGPEPGTPAVQRPEGGTLMLGVKRLGALGSLVLIGLLPAGAAYATTATPTPSPSHSASGAASQQDTQYLTTIHQVNLAVIQAGNLAQQHGASPQVQELGGQFVTDHAQLDQQVQSVASAAGVTLPDAPTADQQAALDKLQNASGADFDKMWIEDQFVVQNQALQATQTEIAQGTDPAVKQLAEAAAPVLQAHLNALVSAAQALGIPVPGGITVSPGPQGSSGAPTTGGTAPVTPTPTVS